MDAEETLCEIQVDKIGSIKRQAIVKLDASSKRVDTQC
jgi:hypothetical protein